MQVSLNQSINVYDVYDSKLITKEGCQLQDCSLPPLYCNDNPEIHFHSLIVTGEIIFDNMSPNNIAFALI